MAPDSKHRKDPTDPHLKFMTRSRRLILVTRDHMSSVGRISAEIHELSQSILAEHDEFLRTRSNLRNEDDPGEEEEDKKIQREVSFDVVNSSGHDQRNVESSHQRTTEGNVENSVKLPIRYPHIPNLKLTGTKEHRDSTSRKHRFRHITKLPLVGKIPVQDVQRAALKIYQNPQTPYIQHKPSPRIKQEPSDTHKSSRPVKPVPRLDLHKLRQDEKATVHLPTISSKPAVRRQSALERKVGTETQSKALPVLIKRQVPTYKVPMQIMQPPGYAPRFELRLPLFEDKDKDSIDKKKDKDKGDVREHSAAKRPLPVYKAPTQIMQPPGFAPRLELRLPRFGGKYTSAEMKERENVLERSAAKLNTLPQIVVNSSTTQGILQSGRTNRRVHLSPSREKTTDKVDFSVDGKSLNEVIIPGRKRPDTRDKSRAVSRDSDRRKTLKRKETVILPKVNPCPLVSPDYKSQYFHRPSYLITSPVPMSQLAPTASLESCMSLSPMPHIHQMTLTPRQTVLISGSPTNFLTTSRPGSMIRDTPVQGTITRLPKLVTTG